MGMMFEYFAAEYGWTHNYILDNLTPSQFKLYSELLLCRLDDNKMERQELVVMQGGGDIKEFRSKRKSLRSALNSKIVDKDAPKDGGPSSEYAKNWLASLGGGSLGNKLVLK